MTPLYLLFAENLNKVKVKLSLCITNYHTMQMCMGVEVQVTHSQPLH